MIGFDDINLYACVWEMLSRLEPSRVLNRSSAACRALPTGIRGHRACLEQHVEKVVALGCHRHVGT